MDRFADQKGGVDAAEIIRAQLLHIQEVLNHKWQKALTSIVNVQRIREFATYALQTLFEAIWIKVFRTDDLYEVTDLVHLHFHDKILRADRIQRTACVVRGRSVQCPHENFLFFFLLRMNRVGLVINLQYESLLALTVDLLVHNLNILKVAALLFVLDRSRELVFENRQVKIFRFQLRQITQGPVLILLALLNTDIVGFVNKVFLQ